MLSIGFAALTSCAGKPSPQKTAVLSQTAPASPPSREVAVGQFGIACHTYEQPGTVGETSYSVDVIGKRGVPALTREQRDVVRRIERYIHSMALRFTFLDNGNFLVYDATMGPCADFAPGYWVLNTEDPNTFYEPGEAPGFVHAVPGDAAPTAGPWMRPSPRA